MGLATAAWLVSFTSGFWSGAESTFFLASAWLILVLLGVFTAVTLTLFVSPVRKLDVVRDLPRPKLRSFKVLVPAVGLGVSILGVTLSLVCGPASCRDQPYRSPGLILVGVGVILFMAGVVLLASLAGEPTAPRTE